MPKTGLATQFGYAQEGAFGSRAVPVRFNEITEESLKLAIERMESVGLRAGRRVTEHWLANKKGAAGDVSFEVGNQGFGLLFKNILGAVSSSTATTGGGGVFDHTATLGNLDGLSLTLQVGRPEVSNVIQPFDYLGGKIAEAEFTNEVDGFLMLNLTFDAMDEKTDQTLATAAYATNIVPLSYIGGTITIGGVAVDVSNFSCNINNGLKTDRYFIRGSTLKKEQIEETQVAGREITGSMSAEFDSMTAYNRFTAGTEAQVVAKWVGPATGAAGFNYELELTLPRVRFDGETPSAGGPDVIEQPIPFKALQPTGLSPLSIRYRTTDSTP